MRKRLFPLFAIAWLLVIGKSFAQDTTALRHAAFSDGGELVLFQNDSTNLYYGPLNTSASFNALFHHPQTGNLYCLYDSVQGSGRRDFYQLDPFSNAMTFQYRPAATYLAAACVGPGGAVYALKGNGGPGAGAIYQIDLLAGTESLFKMVDITFGGTVQTGANISYYPPNNELWIFVGAVDSIFKINVSTLAETHVSAFLNGDGGIKATYLDGNTFWLCSDLSYTFDATGDSIHESAFTIPDYFTDIERLDLIEGNDTLAICDGDSVQLRSRFRFDDYHWYHNGNLLVPHNRTILVGTPGTYQLLSQWDTGNAFIWSETVEIVAQAAPVAGFGFVPAAPVTGVPVIFSDSSLNASVYAWDFGDGTFSALSTPNHTYTTPGTYTVMQIVQNGFCTDTAFATITVTLGVGVDPSAGEVQSLQIAPNPSAGDVAFTVALGSATHCNIMICNLQGQVVRKIFQGDLEAGTYRFDAATDAGSELKAGVYLVQMQTAMGTRNARLVVLR